MVRLLSWLRIAGAAGAARSAGRVLREHDRAERAVDALALRLAPTSEASNTRAA